MSCGAAAGNWRILRRRAAPPRVLAKWGTFRLKHKLLFIANALKQHHLGLEETDDGLWSIYFGTVLLAKSMNET